MDAIVVLAVIIGILGVLFLLDRRLSRNRSPARRRRSPADEAVAKSAQYPHQTNHWSGMGGGNGGGPSG